jgi:thioredoxin 1
MSEPLIATLTDATFAREVERRDGLVLVDFWAAWCAPCHALLPVLVAFAEAHEDEVRVVKLNVDENPETAARYEVRALPTMAFFQNGQEVAGFVGMVSLEGLEETFAELLAGDG